MKSPDELALDEFSSKVVTNDDVCATNYLNFIYSKYRTESKTSGDEEKNMLREELLKIFEDDLQLNSTQDKLPDNNIDNNDEDIIDIKKNLTYSGSCISSENCSIPPKIDNFIDSNDDEILTTSYYQPSYFATTTTTTITTKTNTINNNNNSNDTIFDIFHNDDKSNHVNNVSLNSSITKLTLGNLIAPNLSQQNYYEEMVRNKTVTCDADLLLYSYMQQNSLNYVNEIDLIEDEYIEINYDDYNVSEGDEYEIVDNNDFLNIMNAKLENIKFVNGIENKTSEDTVEFF